jgi:alkanesulfonate monooxygenase SsuD/methylene tetrahydromethanopterin reductase-like flavin-dependent oxidoreductase (luciferase family)
MAELRNRLAALEAACEAVGRPVAEIERSLETEILIAPDRASLRQRLRDMVALAPNDTYSPDVVAYLAEETEVLPPSLTKHYVLGTPDEVTAQLQQYIELGITHFMLWFMDIPNQAGLRLFAESVAPRFRG